MESNGRTCVLLFTILLFMLLSGTTSGKEQLSTDRVVYNDHILAMLAETRNQWADVYLPVAVSPTSPCGQALHAMFTNLQNNTSSLWALQMVDAWGKINDGGVFFGNFQYPGRYDECLATSSPDGKVKGKPCRVNTYLVEEQKLASSMSRVIPGASHLGQPALPWLGPILLHSVNKDPRTIIDSVSTTQTQYWTCIPDVCSQEELTMSVNLQNQLGQKTIAEASCSHEDPEPQFTNADVGFMSVFTFLVVLIVCSSLVDMYITYVGNKAIRKGALKYLLVFSAYTNLPKMLQVNPNPSPDTISCLHGMRLLSMTWVLYSHQQSTKMYFNANLFFIYKRADGLLQQTITNGFPSVDTFFFFSGLLVAYSVLRGLSKGKFNIVIFFFHRLIRLVPPIAIVVGLCATVARFFVAGPFAYIWPTFWQANCINNWWRDMVFINNFMKGGDCLGQVWYVAVDTQLYIIAPIVILPLFFRENFGKAWLYVVTIVSAIIPAAITYVNDYPPTSLMSQPPNAIQFFQNDYLVPWCRAEPWVAGIWLGYIFYKQNNKKVKLSPLVVTVGWTVAAISGLLIVYGLQSYNRMINPKPYEIMTQVVYGGLHRLAWGACLVWVVFACHNGYGGVVDDFLSHPVWQPISRLTYSMYLVAFPMQFLVAYNIRISSYYTDINEIIDTVGSFVIALPIGVLVSLMAESPVMGLEKLLLAPSPSRKRADHNSKKSNELLESKMSEIGEGVQNAAFNIEESKYDGKQHIEKNSTEYQEQTHNEKNKVTRM